MQNADFSTAVLQFLTILPEEVRSCDIVVGHVIVLSFDVLIVGM